MATGHQKHGQFAEVSDNGIVRIEAESLDLAGYQVEGLAGSGASAGRFISLRFDDDGVGTASGAFQGKAGVYDIKVGGFDENDGQSQLTITIGGNDASLVFDQDLPSRMPDTNTQTTTTTHEGIALEPGDTIEISGQADGWEFARLDFIDFIPVEPAADPDPTPDPVPDPVPDPTPDPVPDPTPDPEPPPSNDPSAGYGDFEQEVLRLTNAFRAENGLDALTIDPRLNEAAEAHSRDMADQDFFSHTSPDGSSAGDRIEDAGYDWIAWAENIAAGQPEPEDVVEAWIGSPGHRANLLNANVNEIGIGYVNLEPDTGSLNYNHYWTQVFGAESDILMG